MRRSNYARLRAAAVLGCVALMGCAGAAQTPANAAEAAATGAPAKGACIIVNDIDYTKIVDDSTILFHLHGGRIWKNTLPYACPGLKVNDGFEYSTQIHELCSNLQSIRVLEHAGGPHLGTSCLLGEFTPYTPPPKPGAS